MKRQNVIKIYRRHLQYLQNEQLTVVNRFVLNLTPNSPKYIIQIFIFVFTRIEFKNTN